jgi:hypothetical protein
MSERTKRADAAIDGGNGARARGRLARLAAATLLALGAFAFAGCSSTQGYERTGEWVEADITIASDRVLRQVASIALERNGFPPGTGEAGDFSVVTSGWKVILQPFKSDGTRAKAHVAYTEKDAQTWTVAVRVEKQTNEELAKPLDLGLAKWEDAPDDNEAATRILEYMRTIVGTEFKLGPKVAPTDAERIDSRIGG